MICPRCDEPLESIGRHEWWCCCCGDIGHSDKKDTKILYFDRDHLESDGYNGPSACSACGNPYYPECMDSCNIID